VIPTEAGSGKNKKTINPCETGGEVPEPATWLLMISGLAAVYWKARHRLTRNVVA
jgi:PEP-CTERM motif